MFIVSWTQISATINRKVLVMQQKLEKRKKKLKNTNDKPKVMDSSNKKIKKNQKTDRISER